MELKSSVEPKTNKSTKPHNAAAIHSAERTPLISGDWEEHWNNAVLQYLEYLARRALCTSQTWRCGLLSAVSLEALRIPTSIGDATMNDWRPWNVYNTHWPQHPSLPSKLCRQTNMPSENPHLYTYTHTYINIQKCSE